MDRLTPRAEIEAAGREMGIIPGDPAYVFVQAMQRQADDLERAGEETRRILVEARQPVQPFTDQQVADIGRRFAQAGIAHLTGFTRNEFRKGWGIALGSAAMLLVVGIAIGWLAWGRGPAMTCENQRGGQVCWAWTIPPQK